MSSEDRKKEFKEIKKQLIKERQEEASIVRKIVAICLLVFVLLFVVAGITAFIYVKSALGPIDVTDDSIVEVEIPIGSTSTKIGTILEEHDLIESASFFRYYVRYKNEQGFQAGNYELKRSMSLDEMIDLLKEGTVFQDIAFSFTIPEGRWLEFILQTISEQTDHELVELEEKVRDQDYLATLIERYFFLTEEILNEDIRWPLEGYLFPARYDFVEEDTSIEKIIETMLDRTESVLNKYEEEFEASQFTVHEILSLASIVEGEAQQPEDRYIISGVLYNRLGQNMPLQVDPTIAYAHGEHLSRTLYEHLEIDSPYNTYRYTGIPVGPINNPGEAAIKATLQPQEHDYLFFYARNDGKVMYTKTYEEHKEVLRKYRDNN